MNITGKQCKQARGLLKWNVRELEYRSQVRAAAIEAFEDGSKPVMAPQREQLYKAFKKEGIIFLDMGDVKLEGDKKSASHVQSGGGGREAQETYTIDTEEMLALSDPKRLKKPGDADSSGD